jgi:hypothetical protein
VLVLFGNSIVVDWIDTWFGKKYNRIRIGIRSETEWLVIGGYVDLFYNSIDDV